MARQPSTRTYPPPAFGRTIRAARQAQGLSVRQLAAILRTGHGYVAGLERCERSPSTSMAELLTDALGLDGDAAAVVRKAAVPGVGRDRTFR